MTKSKRPVVIGLEVHLQLNTATKLFCSCSTDYIGHKPNTNVCPICLAVPGSLPRLNDRAVELAARMGLGLGCEIQRWSIFHRKNYFYPDLPKAYQITQYTVPIATRGHVYIDGPDGKKRIRVHHLHLEEDAGKLVHATGDGRLSGAAHSFVDYSRGGVPLSEIVSEPDMSSPAEARAYVVKLRTLARYLGVSNGEMESGSLRVDANISLTSPDGSLGTRVEIKNMNSLRSLERALEHEISRQNKVLDSGSAVTQETRLWDDAEGVTRSMRNKETASDYRYYPEMDLAPIVLEDADIARIKASMPELPDARRERFITSYALRDDAADIALDRGLGDYFERTVHAGASPQRASNWMRMEVTALLKEEGIDIDRFEIAPEALADLLIKIDKKELSATAAREVFVMMRHGLSAEEAASRLGVTIGAASGDTVGEAAAKVVSENGDVVQVIRSGADKKGKKMQYLVGLVMRETRGQADAAQAAGKLEEMIRSL